MTSAKVPRVLVVDHEQPLVRLVAEHLSRDGFHVTVCCDGPTVLRAARQAAPDVVVLDLELTGSDAVEVCRQLRTFSDCYVVMLTAKPHEVDDLIDRSAGADDYLTKPFLPAELVSRIRAMLNRPQGVDLSLYRPRSMSNRESLAEGAGTEPLQFGSLQVDVARRAVHLDDRRVELTPIEFDLLATLAAHPEVAFTRRRLIDAVWGPAWTGDERLVDVHMGHLRRKLGDGRHEQRLIRTVRGVGYQMGLGS